MGGLIIIIALLIPLTSLSQVQADDLTSSLPPPKIHPLPSTLAQWQNDQNTEDYFEQVTETLVGYLIWSKFPINVYLDRPPNPDDTAASTRRFVEWSEAVTEAIAQWNVYLPLKEVEGTELADIIIKRTDPPLDGQFDPKTGQLQISRARAAQTRYNFYIQDRQLFHRMIIEISPRGSQSSILVTARHELGHALGIWGHSPKETDALYFSQVRTPPLISVRDINTLKKIYQQSTRLGWMLPP
ncbi:peptidase [Aphanothece sacrum]|uniref:Peptidase n=1 Tax=Aphanothece sacrum FPU1 TaxID=1920663 RepID=A0A401IN77_APHSA|nr:peptidase [Aphanothece sacrum]GBF82688.1 peptidase [Aphanothece sacrum FPU1]GBF84520.1 peptidase [Aphanothece sacrum FPU3]